jgi:hypothetical protein
MACVFFIIRVFNLQIHSGPEKSQSPGAGRLFETERANAWMKCIRTLIIIYDQLTNLLVGRPGELNSTKYNRAKYVEKY